MKYRVTTEVWIENEDGWTRKEASVGDTVEADSFTEALPKFNEALNTQWQRVAELAPMIDSQAPAPSQDQGDAVELKMPDGKVVQALIIPSKKQ